MSIYKAIYSKLTTTSAITALIGNRVYPEAVPQGEAFPLLVYWEGSPQMVNTSSGYSGLCSQSVEIACIATTFEASKALSDVVVSALNNTSGTWGGIKVQGSFITDVQMDRQSIPDSGSDAIYFIDTITATVWYESL